MKKSTFKNEADYESQCEEERVVTHNTDCMCNKRVYWTTFYI